MTACTSPLSMPSEIPFRISRLSTLTCRSLISRSAMNLPFHLFLGPDDICAGGVLVRQPGRPLDGGPQQPLVHRLLAVAGMTGLGGDIADRAVAVPDRERAVSIVHDFGHVAACRCQLADPLDLLLQR